MKVRLIFLLAYLLIYYNPSHAQKTKQDLFNPFSILIIKPDSAKIADTLRAWADSIERGHIDNYYYSIKVEEMAQQWGNEEVKKKSEQRIREIKAREMDAYNFKYYHTVAYKTLYELAVLFNTNYWEKNFASRQTVLDGDVIDRNELFTYDLKKLADYYEVDYIVTFENIHTDHKDGVGTLKYTVTLFWSKKNKIILRKEIEGNAPVNNFNLLQEIFPNGEEFFHESGIHCDNYLECMFKSVVRFSTEEIFKVISKNQRK